MPAAAGATVFCVDTTPGELLDNAAIDPSCETAHATVGDGLQAALSNPGPDTVLVGPGDYTLPDVPSGVEAAYSSLDPANVLFLRGLGQPHLTMGGTGGFQRAFWISAPAGSMVEGLQVTIPANADVTQDRGFELSNAVAARRIEVDGPAATNAVGISLAPGTTLAESSVDLPIAVSPSNIGVSAAGGGTGAIVDSAVSAGTAILTSGAVITIERASLEARIGISADSGTVKLRDSLIDLGQRNNAIGVRLANDNTGSLTIGGEIDGTTIVGGGTNSAGVRVQANNGTETADATIANTVIEGPTAPIQVWADNGRAATVTAGHSNFDGTAVSEIDDLDGSGEAGTATYTSSEITDLDPGFVDPAAGDFHLASTSPLIDLGDPADPPAGALDFERQLRAADPAACPVAPGRRDIGADEVVPDCTPPGGEGPGPGGGAGGPVLAPASRPETRIAGRRRVATTAQGASVVFRISSPVAGASFRCKVDNKPYRPCGPRLRVWLKRGRHVVRAVATAAGASDPTPAVLRVRVVAKDR